MQAVILAAGTGQRLRPITDNLPKCLIQIGEKTLLEYSLDALRKSGIGEVIIVTGFLENMIKEKIGNNYKDVKITFILNEKYDRTGSMYSLSQAKSAIKDKDILLLESDLLYEPQAIKTALNSPFKDCILVSDLSNSGDEVYICVDENFRLRDLGKNVPFESKINALGELVGISRYSKELLELLFKKAEEDYSQGEFLRHYEEFVFSVNQLGYPVYALLCKGLAWIEIDKKEDLERAEQVIYPKIKRLALA